MVSDEDIRAKVAELLPTVDMETTGLKQFLKLLSSALGGVNLKSRKDFVKQALTEALAEQQQEQQEDDDDEEEAESEPEQEDDNEDDDDDDGVPTSKAKKKGSGGLAAKKEISPQLQAFLKMGDHMPRTEIVKALWNYIRKHNLQNPSNKKEILLDAAMKKVFGCDTFTMFSMNKYIGAHIHPFKPVDLTPSTPNNNSKSRAAKRKAPSASKGGSGSSGTKKPRKAGTQPPYRLSEALQAVVGTDILPRPQVVSKIWDYIRAHNLQNPADKREILCDSALRRVMGNKAKVTMFKMNTFLGEHLIEKVDKESYQHDGEEEEQEEEEEEYWYPGVYCDGATLS